MRDGRLAAFGAPGIVTLVALVARFHGLGDKPFWLDEILTVNRARLPFRELILDSLHNLHFPTYFLLVSPFSEAVGTEWAVRAPSAVFGALVAGMACVIGQALKDAKIGLCAGLLTALSPFQVQFSQEARSYTLVALLILLALWGVVQIAKATDQPGDESRQDLRLAWIAYVGGTLLAMLVHNSALMWLLAANLSAIGIGWRQRRGRTRFVRLWLAAQAGIIGIWLPSFLAMLPYLEKAATSIAWIPPATFASILAATKSVYLFRVSDSVMYELGPRGVPGLGIAMILLAGAGLWRLRRQPATLIVLLAALLVLPFGLLLASLYEPIFLPRYLLWAAPPLFILAGLGLAWIPGRAVAPAIIVLALGLAWNLRPYYAFESKPRWDLVARNIADHARPGDVVMVRNINSRMVYKFYRDRYGPDVAAVPRVLELNEASQAMIQGHAVWAILGRSGFGQLMTVQAYLDEAAVLGPPARTERFGAHITLFRFDPPGG